MANHGSLSFSFDLTDTYYKLEILDAYCRVLLLTKQLGSVNQLDQKQMTDLLEVKKNFGLPDERLSCAPTGCVGSENQPFLASFPVHPTTASCDCDGGVTSTSEGNFEAMVQAITDQIVTSMGK